MNGLDKLIERIESESREEIGSVLAEAGKKAETIKVDSARKAAAECAAIEKRSAADVETINQRAKASADLKKKQILLSGRQELIGGTIAMVRERLSGLSDSEYADFIAGLLRKHVPARDAVLKFAGSDLERLPESILEDFISSAASNGARVTVSASSEVKNGFILDFGGIEENCTFDALIDQNTEMLEDEIRAILFA